MNFWALAPLHHNPLDIPAIFLEIISGLKEVRTILTLTLALSALCVQVNAQGTTLLDSLNGVMEGYPEGSEERTDVMIEISKELSESVPDSALALAKKAGLLAQDLENDALLARAYVSVSVAYSYKAMYDSSVSYSIQGLNLATLVKDTLTILDAYNNLGIDFMYQEDYGKSEAYYIKLKELSTDYGDTLRWAHSLNNLGMLYGLQGKYKIEIEHYQEAEVLFEKIGDQEGYANTLINTGTTHTALGNYKEAENYYKKALDIYRIIDYKSALAHTLMNLAENDFKAGRKRLAYDYAYAALDIVKENNFEQDEIYLYEQLEGMYENDGNFRRAFEFQRKRFNLKEEVFNAEKSRQINELETQYQTSAKEAEIVRLKLQNELGEVQLSQTRWQMAFVLAGALSLTALAIFLYWLKLKKVRAEKVEQDLRFEALQKRYMELLNGPAKVDFGIDLDEFNKKLFNPLTSREYDVLRLSMSGKTNQEIADEIFVSLSTIKFHMGNIYNKLGVSNKKEALEYVVKSS